MRMRNVFGLLSIMLAFVLALSGCSVAEKKTTGIGTAGGKEYYIIDLKQEDIEEYFTLVGEKSKVSVLNTQTGKSQITYYQPIEEGGWLAYNGGSIVAYFPSTFSQSNVKTACAMLTLSSEGMTIEEAKEYITWLNE